MTARLLFALLVCFGSILRAADAVGILRAADLVVPNRSLRGAKVVRVTRGDEVVIAVADGSLITVHLHGIAAPELDQPFGVRAKEELTKFCLDKSSDVFVEKVVSQTEVYGIVFAATTATGSTNANIEMIRRGCAWYDVGSGVVKKKDFEQSYRNSNLVDYETDAKRAHRGLWTEKNPVPPWEWRKRKKPNQPSEPTSGLAPGRGSP